MKATVFVFSNYTFMQIIITEATKKTGTIEISSLYNVLILSNS